jgi:hypothetical protein
MRLSEDRIRHLADRIAKDLVEKKAVEAGGGARFVAGLITQAMIQDLRREDEIDAEARRRLLRYPGRPPEGSGADEALFQKIKREVAMERGYPL